MKKHLLLIAVCMFAGAVSASAQIVKIGTVDFKKVFDTYYKTKEAETKITDARMAAKKELDERVETLNKLSAEVNKLNEEIGKPELSKENKDQKAKSRDEKISELQTMDREIKEFRMVREKQITDQMMRMRGSIVDEINKVVADKVKSENYHLVLEKSGASTNGVPVVLYAKDEYDFTDSIIATLNKGKGKEEAEAPKKK